MDAMKRFMPPEEWQALKLRVLEFACRHPLIASLALGQIIFSGIPLVMFVLLSVGVLIFSVAAGLLTALFGALLFTAFCVSIALLILLPTLFITSFMGVTASLWMWGAYYLVQWFRGDSDKEQDSKRIPGLTSGIIVNGGQTSNGEKQMEENASKSPSYEKTPSSGTKQYKYDLPSTDQLQPQPTSESSLENGVAKTMESMNVIEVLVDEEG
jgi:hypothetical protein